MFDNQFGSYRNVECGLVCYLKRAGDFFGKPQLKPIPLVSVVANACVVHAVAHVELTQIYINQESIPIEAIYYFPVDSNGSVTNFHAEIEGRKIKGVVKAAEEAKAQYEKAVQANKTAFLVEQNKPDIFKVRVGFLKPGCEAKITIGYVTEVKNERDSDAMRFFIPTTIAPRYTPSTSIDEKSKDLANMSFSTSSPAPLSIRINVYIQGEFKHVRSPTHAAKIQQFEAIPEKKNWSKIAVELAGTTTDMDRDFVLLFEPVQKHIPRLYCEKLEDGSVAVMTHFIPSFKLKDQKVELYFVLDRSGSMRGKSIALAKKALSLFLRSMPVNCVFNVIGFGNTYQVLFPSSSAVEYNDHNLSIASSYAMSLDADLGGTEILKPLKHIYDKPLIPGFLRQIFVLTDGEVANTEQIIGLVKRNAHTTRVFALGIGDGASHHLVEGIANAGGGTSAFVTYNEAPNAKVVSQLKNALQPSLTDVTIKWEGVKYPPASVTKPPVVINKEPTLMGYGKPLESSQEEPSLSIEKSFRQAPLNIPPIFDGSQMVILGLFSNEIPTAATISAVTPDGPLTLSISMNEESNIGSTGMLHKLASVKIIRDLEVDISSFDEHENLIENSKTKETLKKQIVDIACKHQIGSKYTSFVAVDESNEQNVEDNWAMESRCVPSQLTHGHGTFGGSFRMQQSLNSRTTLLCNQMIPQNQMQQSLNFRATPISAQMMPQQQQQQSFCFGASTQMMPQQQQQQQQQSFSFGTSAQMMPQQQQQSFSFGTSAQMMPQQKQQQQLQSFSFGSASSTSAGSLGYPAPKLGFRQSRSRSAVLFGPQHPSSFSFGSDSDGNALNNNVEDSLVAFVSLQSFNGSFKLDQNLSTFLQKSLDSLKEVSTKNNWNEEAWATALAIFYFIHKFQDQKDSWELIVDKAKLWLTKNHENQAELILNAAQSCIAS